MTPISTRRGELPSRVEPPLSVTDSVRYQGAVGDFNPLHHDWRAAEAAGHSAPFAVGGLTAGIMATYLADLFGPDTVRYLRFRFHSPAWPGDELTYSGEWELRSDGGGEEVHVRFRVAREPGDPHISGEARFAVGNGPATGLPWTNTTRR